MDPRRLASMPAASEQSISTFSAHE